MANELNLSLSPAQTGLTVTAILIQANAQVGSSISCPESGTVAGHYSGNMPAISAGVYGVNFLSSGQLIGSGSIDWDGAKERGLVDLPTVAQVEARTLPSAEYFNPSTDAVSTVTNLTNLPVIPNNWITAAGISSDAITKIQTGLATASAVSAIPTTPLLANDIRLDNLDATISSRSTYNGNDTPGTTTLLSRLTSERAIYLDKLNVTGTIAHSDSAATYRANVSGLLTESTYVASLPSNFGALGINANGHINRVTLVDTTTTNSDMRGTDGAITSISNVTVGGYATGQSPADLVTGFATATNVTDAQSAIINHGNINWATATGFLTSLGVNAPANWINAASLTTDSVTKIQSGLSTFDGDLSTVTTAISNIPTNPLLTNDIRLNNLDAAISSRSNFDHALNQVTVATNNDKTNYQLADNAITSNKIQDGALTAAKFATGAFNAIWSVATRTLTSISDSAGVTTLLSRVTDLVPTKTEFDNRTLPSNQYSTASNLDTVLTRTARVDSLIEDTIGGDRFTTKALETAPSGDSAATIYTYFTEGARADAFKATGFSTLTANQVWEYTDRSLTGTQATNLASIANIPTNPLLVTDIRIDDIKAKTDQLTFIEGNVVSTLNGEEVTISNSGINAIVSGVNGTLVIPTAVQIRTEIDTNSTELAAIKTIAIGARNNAAAGL